MVRIPLAMHSELSAESVDEGYDSLNDYLVDTLNARHRVLTWSDPALQSLVEAMAETGELHVGDLVEQLVAKALGHQLNRMPKAAQEPLPLTIVA